MLSNWEKTEQLAYTTRQWPKIRKPGVDDSPDKSLYELNKTLDICGKCNKKCSSKAEAIQCDMCCMWVHATVTMSLENNTRQLNHSPHLKTLCNNNNCLDRLNSITSE